MIAALFAYLLTHSLGFPLFLCLTTAFHLQTTTIAKMVSKEWREMTPEEREFWEDKSKTDKARYEQEMVAYNEARKSSKRSKRDPDAPKRPMSAFLAFSNKRRAALKRENPKATNADLSKMLSVKWKEATPEFKASFIEEEAKLRAKYKIDIVAWRKKKSEELKTTMANHALQVSKEKEAAKLEAAKKQQQIQQQPQQQLSQGPNAALMTSFGGAGSYMPQGAAGLDNILLQQGRQDGFYAGGMPAEQFLQQGGQNQFAAQQFGLGQSQLQGQLLAAQGLQIQQGGFSPSLQALMGNNPMYAGYGAAPADGGLQAAWLQQNAGYAGMAGLGGGGSLPQQEDSGRGSMPGRKDA